MGTKTGRPARQGYFLEELPSGRWRGGTRTPSGRKIQQTFDYEYEAESFAIATRDRIRAAAGEGSGATSSTSPDSTSTDVPSVPQIVSQSVDSPTLLEFGGHWLRVNRADWEAPTYDGYEIQYRNGIRDREEIRAIRLCDLNVEDVKIWRSAQVADGVGIPTINRRMKILRIILNYAIATKRISENVASGIDDLGTEDREFHVLTEPEEIRLLEQCRTPEERAMVLLALDAGLRWGEVAGLAVDGIVDGGRFVVVRQIVERKSRKIRKYPKSKRSRVIPTTKRLREALAVVEIVAATRGRDALLFPTFSPDGTIRPLCARNFLRDFWHGATHRAKLNTRGDRFHFHDLRHTYGSRLAAAGVPPREIQELMGHASMKTTEIYLHAQSNERRAELIASAIG